MKTGFARLILKLNESIQKEYLMDKDMVIIGRQKINDIVIEDFGISKHHAKIEIKEGRYIITDLSSTNGTYVNNKRIDQIELRNGYEVKVGKYIMIFKSEDTVASFNNISSTSITSNNPLPEKFQRRLIIAESGNQTIIDLTENELIIGNSESSDINIPGLFLPPNIMSIKKEDSDYYLIPITKRATIRLNGLKVNSKIRLNQNDIIEIRQVRIIYQ